MFNHAHKERSSAACTSSVTTALATAVHASRSALSMTLTSCHSLRISTPPEQHPEEAGLLWRVSKCRSEGIALPPPTSSTRISCDVVRSPVECIYTTYIQYVHVAFLHGTTKQSLNELHYLTCCTVICMLRCSGDATVAAAVVVAGAGAAATLGAALPAGRVTAASRAIFWAASA